ncbi:ATP synthase F0F1 subunit gamma [Platysternon megacephalum]|uniref:ATP synthase F0F1 subunit gamma n=1 Tax=Platysternon megacephalum TaxID=55544 RepID=A0A4D9DJ43_9SAUR|nr:ATP synthase F0F1 subunit gamma [Platysternon megacephalum]
MCWKCFTFCIVDMEYLLHSYLISYLVIFYPSIYVQVQLGQADIKCPITECSEYLDETIVLYNLPHDDIIKYKYFLELSRIDSSTKPCPQCKRFTTFRRRGHIPTPTKLENKYKVSMLTKPMD